MLSLALNINSIRDCLQFAMVEAGHSISQLLLVKLVSSLPNTWLFFNIEPFIPHCIHFTFAC